ncbi:hypothetical protein ACHAXA_011810 [Cyclostephanos tholiformis]|uniref:Uncharacterized protein n=1 Tax=Cyclostephanos tholiformis TaxID=382380 RepID=A0ABD3RAZ1_9STRA
MHVTKPASSIRYLSYGVAMIAALSLQYNHATAFSSNDCSSTLFTCRRIAPSQRGSRYSQIMTMSRTDESSNCNNNLETQNVKRLPGRKRALLGKCGKAIAISTTLLYGPVARHYPRSTVHAASPYEEILAKVEVEGEKAFEDIKHGDIAALTIGESHAEVGEAAASGGKSLSRKERKDNKKKSQRCTNKGKLSLSKTDSGGKGGGDVLLTDKMAYNNYKAPMSKEEQNKVIKKLAFYSIFPVFVITTIRGQIKAYKEKKWVKKGLALVEEERQKYLEEKKKKKEGKNDDDDDDDDNES